MGWRECVLYNFPDYEITEQQAPPKKLEPAVVRIRNVQQLELLSDSLWSLFDQLQTPPKSQGL